MARTRETLPRVLIAGVSTRALAVSAARAGYQVTAIDAFGDLDLRGSAEVIALRGEFGVRYSPLAAVTAAASVPGRLAAYTSNFENYPAAVAGLMRRFRLLGNPPAVLTRVRNPIELMRTLRGRGFATPDARATPLPHHPRPGSWLLKPRRSGGGHGTRVWRRGQRVPRTHYLQERIAGLPASIVFAADGRSAVPLGLSRQLVGDARFGAHGFRYCGSLLGPATGLLRHQEKLLEGAARLANAVTEAFGLVGLNGIDLIARNGVPYPIEVNPRYAASMELVERARGLSIFEVHARACDGALPAPFVPLTTVEGKAIIFARRNVILGDTRAWLEHGSFADVPHPGEMIRRGHPICTVFASGRDAAACHRLLVRRAAGVYRAAELSKRGAA
jgi:predicted ATP-grasp superfamily ATP-dependent carboligase